MLKMIKPKWLTLLLLLVAFVAALDLITVHTTHGKSQTVEITPLGNTVRDLNTDQINVMTVNMAHGRADGSHQALQSTDTITSNINAIGRLIAREDAHIVAMQEADAPSWWSGQFSHVNHVGQLGGMTAAIQGLNVEGLGLNYGTAIVTRLKADNAQQVTFDKNLPTLSKGFVTVTCEWPRDADFKFDVVSLHLDFASQTVRQEQLSVLRRFIASTDRPMIIMGDFNTDMSADLLPDFMQKTQLQTWQAEDESIVTFPFLQARIDWIFTSPELRIVQQTVLDDVVSDHKVLTATIERVL